jgi:hypothetical protein
MEIKPADEVDASLNIDRQIARLMVRAIWQQEWSAANPEATPKDRAAAWKEVRATENQARIKTYRKAIVAMRKAGVEISLILAEPDAAEDEGEDA